MSQIINPPAVNYMPQQQPDFMQSYLEGLKFGQDLQTFKKQQELNLKQEAFNQDYQGLLQNPSGSGMLNLMTKYPEFAKSLQPIQEAYSAQEKQGQLSTMMQISNALENGNPDLAKQLVEGAKTAFKNSGISTQNLDIISQTIDKSPQTALGSINMTLAQLMGADKYKQFQEAQTTVAERPYKVSESASKAKSSQVQMEIDISTKQAKIDELRAKASKATSDAEKAEIEAEIAKLTKELKVDEQKYKTTKVKEEAKQEEIKTTYLEPKLKQEIEKGNWDIDKIKAEIGLTKASTQLKYLEAKEVKELNPLKKQKLQIEINGLKTEINSKTNEKVAGLNTGRETIDNMTNTIDKLLKSEALDSIVGPNASYLPVFLMSPKQADANALLETLKSQTFLSQVSTMKGMGALSDAEGKKLQAGVANLERAQSPEQLRASLKTVRTIMSNARRNLEVKYGVGGDTGITKKIPARPNKDISDKDIQAILDKYGVK